MKWYLQVLRNYAQFDGRARRKEYWMFLLFNLIFIVVSMTIDYAFGLAEYYVFFGPTCLFYIFAIAIPAIAVTIRRLHDIYKSGWMILVSLVPFAGPIWLLILMVLNGKTKENQFGTNPKTDSLANLSNGKTRGNIIVFIATLWMLLYSMYPDISLASNFYIVGLLLFAAVLVIPIITAIKEKDNTTRITLFVMGGIPIIYYFVGDYSGNLVESIIMALIPICFVFILKDKAKKAAVISLSIFALTPFGYLIGLILKPLAWH